MNDKQAEKLFYGGTTNFSGDFIVKVYLNDIAIEKQSASALLICERNISCINSVDPSKFNFVVISPEVINKKNQLNLDTSLNIFKSAETISFLNEGDVIELLANEAFVRLCILYRIESDNNVIITTSHCNNKCIMCPQPIYISKEDDVDLSKIEKIISMMGKQTKFLTITGGEPSLLKDKLIEILRFCKSYLPNTKVAVLTNGRMFSYCSLVDAINSVGMKFLEIGIPIHSCNQDIHDRITQIPGSFAQTVLGVKNLNNSNNNVEIRIVIQKDNYLEMDKLADFIIKEIPNISRVSFIGMEMLGSAIKNSKETWVSYQEIGSNLEEAILKLLTHKIKVDIYNIPLCKVNENLRSLCVKSISDYKVRYLPECDSCKEKANCGGIFASSLNSIKQEGVNPII